MQYNGFAKCTVYGLHLLRDNPFNRGVDESCTNREAFDQSHDIYVVAHREIICLACKELNSPSLMSPVETDLRKVNFIIFHSYSGEYFRFVHF